MRDPGAPERVLQRLEFQVIRRLDGLLQGDYRSLFLGSGVDLANLREYQYFDDVRHIDWNVTARTGTPHVRIYHEDREIEAWFLVDLSPSVDFGVAERDRDKRAVVVDLVTVLTRLLSRHGNRVGAMLYGDRVDRTIPPRTGRDQVLRITDALLDAPRLPGSEPTELSTLLEAALRTDQAPLDGGHRLRLHQHPRLGTAARAARPASRGARGARR